MRLHFTPSPKPAYNTREDAVQAANHGLAANSDLSRLHALSALSHRIQHPENGNAPGLSSSVKADNHEHIISQLRAENSRLMLKMKASTDETKRQDESMFWSRLAIACRSFTRSSFLYCFFELALCPPNAPLALSCRCLAAKADLIGGRKVYNRDDRKLKTRV